MKTRKSFLQNQLRRRDIGTVVAGSGAPEVNCEFLRRPVITLSPFGPAPSFRAASVLPFLPVPPAPPPGGGGGGGEREKRNGTGGGRGTKECSFAILVQAGECRARAIILKGPKSIRRRKLLVFKVVGRGGELRRIRELRDISLNDVH